MLHSVIHVKNLVSVRKCATAAGVVAAVTCGRVHQAARDGRVESLF